MEDHEKQETPKWLKHLQENSWEAEILISGGAIFSLLQLVDLLISLRQSLRESTYLLGLNESLFVLVLVVRGVTIGFVIHLFLRGFWIALVCLRSAYPEGINFSKLKISSRFLNQSRRANLTKQIVQLDQLSGLIFFASFIFILIFIGVIPIYFILEGLLSFFALPEWFSLVIIFPYLLDMFTSGVLRRNGVVGKLFYPVYWFLNAFSLGFVYRPLLQIISTNISKWKVGLFFIFMLICSYGFMYVSVQKTLHWGNLFDEHKYESIANELEIVEDLYLDRIPNEEFVRWACIQSDFIKDDYVKVFIPYKAKYDDRISKAVHKTFAEIVTLSLNDSIKLNPEWIRYSRKPSDQFGVVTYLPIEKLPKGKNELTIQIDGEKFYHYKDRLIIPFWKE